MARVLGKSRTRTSVVINNPPVKINKSEKVLKKGGVKVSYSMRVDAEPLLFTLDDRKLAAPIAEGLQAAMKARLRTYDKAVSQTTQQRRDRMYRDWYSPTKPKELERRFSGGKMGETSPKQGQITWFDHSGRFIKSLKGRYVPKTGEWIYNVAGNRLNRDKWYGDQRFFEAFLDELGRALDMKEITKNPAFRRGMRKSQEDSVEKLKSAIQAKKAQLRKDILGLFF